jgi:D-glycerate 3-kinase
LNQPGQPPIQAVILEGWCVGFRPLSSSAVEALYSSSLSSSSDTTTLTSSTHPKTTLHRHALSHLLLVNDKLRAYDAALTDRLDAFIHIDAQDLSCVYDWRQQQEEHMRASLGDENAGMTREQVVRFVDGYYPAYELYTDGVRKGVLPGKDGAQLRMTVGRDRKVVDVVVF